MVKVNFADVKDYGDELEVGNYHVALVDGDVQQTKEDGDAKHKNVDYWNIEFLVLDGTEQGRREWVNVMLPPYENLFMLHDILKAAFGFTHEQLAAGDFDVELHPEDAENDDTYVLLNEEEPLEFILRKYKNKKGELGQSIKPFDPDKWEVDETEPS